MAEQSFEQWMQAVDNVLYGEVGVGTSDLPDWTYRDAYDDGMQPREAALEVLENADYWA